jgi:hypothetical protein
LDAHERHLHRPRDNEVERILGAGCIDCAGNARDGLVEALAAIDEARAVVAITIGGTEHALLVNPFPLGIRLG